MSQECPRCSSSSTSELKQKTILGYRSFRCGSCERKFNERTGTPFNFLEFPTDVVLLVVRWETRFAPMISDALRRHRRGSLGVSWVVDETTVKVGGRWCYLYRAIDRAGNLVDCRLSETRDAGEAPE